MEPVKEITVLSLTFRGWLQQYGVGRADCRSGGGYFRRRSDLDVSLLLHARHVIWISPASQPPAIGPLFGADLRFAIDICPLERPGVRPFRGIDSKEIGRELWATRNRTQRQKNGRDASL